MKKNKKRFSQYAGVVFFMLIGAACGYFAVQNLDFGNVKALPFGGFGLALGLVIVELYAALYFQILLHEGGHLLFGLLSGYKFLSFRVGSFMWIKREGKICFKRLSISGTGGQCLLRPPALIEGKMPFVLYNLGGAVMNILTALLFLGLRALCGPGMFLPSFLQMAAITGFGCALMNGIPMRIGTVDNDGYNAVSLGKNADALRAFWVQLEVNAQSAQGMRLRDMPEEWFAVPSEEGMKNSMTAVMGVFAANRLMDRKRFDEAETLIGNLLSADMAIVGLHRALLLCDCIFCELLGGGGKEKIDKMLDKGQRKFMKQMQKFPSVLRTQYAYARLYEKDGGKAEKIKTQFEKVAGTYPLQGDIDSERELIQAAEQTALQREAC